MNRWTSICLLTCLFVSYVNSQTQEKSTSPWDQSLDKLSGLKGKEEATGRISAIPMEGSVDPHQYVVGPSDIFTLVFWGAPPMEYTIPVTPEGTLLIPTVGEIRVADISLSEVKNRVTQIVGKKYPIGGFSLTLVKPRTFTVSLRGAVLKPGQYIASAVDRVEKILTEGASIIQSPNTTYTIPALSPTTGLPVSEGDFKVPKVTTKSELYEQASLRNIYLIRRNGDTLHADIPKYYATREDKYNPFLVDGDIVFVPKKNLSMGFISVHGAVNAPGRYEYVAGDSLIDIIHIAQGLAVAANPRAVTIYRMDATGEHIQEFSVNLEDVLAGKKENVGLQQGDRVLVRYQADRRRDYNITLTGEVLFPGTYPITRGSSKLSQIIEAAGGFTDRALLSGSIIWRKEEKQKEVIEPQLEYLSNLRAHQFGMVDSNYFFLDLKLAQRPVVVDFTKLFNEHDTTYDVILQHEDVIHIASNLHSVLVQGQVANPGYVAFVPGADYRHYIRKAGDFQEYADEGEVRIIKKGTLSWFEPGGTTIESGDQVFVPKVPKKNFFYYFSIFRDIAGVTAALATVIIAIQATK